MRKEIVDRAVKNIIESMKCRSKVKALTEEAINQLLDELEKKTGQKVLNKPFRIELEASK